MARHCAAVSDTRPPTIPDATRESIQKATQAYLDADPRDRQKRLDGLRAQMAWNHWPLAGPKSKYKCLGHPDCPYATASRFGYNQCPIHVATTKVSP